MGVVVDGFADAGVVAITHDVRDEGADHLRVAVVAAFLDVDVASGELERGVERLEAVLDVLCLVDDHGGDELDDATDGNGGEGEDGEGEVVLDEALVEVGPLHAVATEHDDGTNGERRRPWRGRPCRHGAGRKNQRTMKRMVARTL